MSKMALAYVENLDEASLDDVVLSLAVQFLSHRNHNFEENVADMMTSLLEKYSINGGLCFTYVAPSWSLSITLLLLQLFASDCVDNPEATFLSLLAYKLPSKHCQVRCLLMTSPPSDGRIIDK